MDDGDLVAIIAGMVFANSRNPNVGDSVEIAADILREVVARGFKTGGKTLDERRNTLQEFLGNDVIAGTMRSAPK